MIEVPCDQLTRSPTDGAFTAQPQSEGPKQAEIDSGESDAARGRWGYIHPVVVSVLLVASLVPIWVGERFPSQNGPWYLLIVHMLKELGNPQWDYSQYYEINWHPVPHMLYEVLLWSLTYVAPLLTAEKLALSICAVLVPASIYYFLSVVAPDKLLIGYLSFLMIHTHSFYRGYHDFVLSVPLFFFVLGFWYRHRNRIGPKVCAVLAVGAVAIYLAHLFTFAVLVATVGLIRLVETRSLSKAVLSTVCCTWTGWLLLVDFLLLALAHPGGFNLADTSFLPPHEAAENFVRKMFYSISFPGYVIATLPWLWLVYGLARRFVVAQADGRLLKSVFSDPLLVATAALCVLYFFVPNKLLGWHYVAIRMSPLVLGLALACVVPFAKTMLVRTAFVMTVCGSTLCQSWLLSAELVRMNETLDEYVSGIDAFEGKARLLPVHVENEPTGLVRPVTRAHEYYHIAKGGANGDNVAKFSHLTSLTYRQPVNLTFPEYDPDKPRESMAKIKEAYGYVLVWGEDRDWFDRLERSGFQLVHHNRRLRLFKNQTPTSTGQNNSENDPHETSTTTDLSKEESR